MTKVSVATGMRVATAGQTIYITPPKKNGTGLAMGDRVANRHTGMVSVGQHEFTST